MVRKAQTKEAPELFINTVTGESGHIIDGKRVVDQPVEIQKKPREGAKAQSQEVAVTTKVQAVVALNPLSETLAVFERLAVNKDVNPDTLGKLLDVQERLLDRQARMAFDQAFIAMQPLLPQITKEGRIQVREKDNQGKRTGDLTQDTAYPKWETIVKKIKPILHEYGFALNHRTSMTAEGKLRVTAILRGHGWEDDSCYFDLMADATGSKNNNQAWGSSESYGIRYTSCAVLNLVIVGQDDDARTSGKPLVAGEPISAEQCDRLIELGRAAGCGWPALRDWLNKRKPKGHPDIETIEQIPSARLEEAVAGIHKFAAAAKDREAGMRQTETRR